MFKDSIVEIPYEDIDLEIRNLVSYINDIDGIETIESCCGHNEKPCFIWCKAESIEALNSFLFNYFDGECLWKITLDVADVHASSKEIRFIISSGEYKDYPVVNLMIDNLTYRFKFCRTQTVPQITVFTETADEKAVADLKAELQNVLKEQRPQGKWTRTGQSFVNPNKFRNYCCSNCLYELDEHIRSEPNYCPNCGAMMQTESKPTKNLIDEVVGFDMPTLPKMPEYTENEE